MDKLKSIKKIMKRLVLGLSIVGVIMSILLWLIVTNYIFLVFAIISFIPMLLVSYLIGDMILDLIKNKKSNKKVGL